MDFMQSILSGTLLVYIRFWNMWFTLWVKLILLRPYPWSYMIHYTRVVKDKSQILYRQLMSKSHFVGFEPKMRLHQIDVFGIPSKHVFPRKFVQVKKYAFWMKKMNFKMLKALLSTASTKKSRIQKPSTLLFAHFFMRSGVACRKFEAL